MLTKNPKQNARWIESINKDATVKIIRQASSRVCSNHFCTDMVDKTGESGTEAAYCANNLPIF